MSQLQEATCLLKQLQPTLEQAHYQVAASDSGIVIQQEGLTPLQLEIEIHAEDTNPALQLVHMVVPLSIDIPDQYWLSAAEMIAHTNRESPLGEFSISEQSRPYFDYRFLINTQSEFTLNLLEAIQMSFVLADRFLSSMQQSLKDWLQGRGRINTLYA